MVCLSVEGLTKKGNKSIIQNYKEVERMSFAKKAVLKAFGISYKKLSDEPAILSIEVNNKASSDPHYAICLKNEIKRTLTEEQGCSQKDFLIRLI